MATASEPTPLAEVRPATEADLEAINAIYNHEVLHGTATWDIEPWSLAQRRAWFAEHDDSTPLMVAEVGGQVAGFAYLSWYRPKAGYRFTREDTLYVAPAYQRRGIGRQLLGRLVEEARRLRMRTLVAVIDGDNEASIALHARFGFAQAGRLPQLGRKFDRWLDVVTMVLLLEEGEG